MLLKIRIYLQIMVELYTITYTIFLYIIYVDIPNNIMCIIFYYKLNIIILKSLI